jgi:hypothetical protein
MRRPSSRYTFLAAAVSVLFAAIGRAQPTELFFSEYIEGSSNNKALEIFNGTGVAVNFATGGYNVQMYFNGSATAGLTINLTGTVANGDVFVLAQSAASAAILAQADQTSGAGFFNGDDAVVLRQGTTVIDVIGQIGFDPGTEWGTGLTSTADNTLTRKGSICAGDSNGGDAFDPAVEWDGFAIDTFDGLGSYTSFCGSSPPTGIGGADPNIVESGDVTLLTVAVTPGTNPASTGITVTGDLSSIGGSASQAFYDDGSNGDALSGDNVFSYQATVTATPGSKSIPVTVADAEARSSMTSIALAVVTAKLAIHDIQGAGSSSPYAGQIVGTTGIVTARRFNNGFFLQDPDADGDPSTSEGIFVFTGGAPPTSAAVGNAVGVAGTVVEFVPSADPQSPPLTEIGGSVFVSVVSTGNALPAPVALTTADTTPAGSVEQLEKYEGMRVSVGSLTVVSPTMGSINETNATSTSNGVFYGVITGIARPFREPGINILDPLPAGSPCCVPRFDENPERLRVDSDGLIGAVRLEATSGATLENVVGPLDYAFRTYTILPDAGTLTQSSVVGNVSYSAVPVRAADEVSIGSFNLQRFFDTVNDPAIGEPILTATAFNNRLNKASLAVRNVMRAPDVIGVQEVENLSTLQALANKINADDPTLSYVAYLEEGNDIGGIDVGFLVNSNRVLVSSVTQVGKTATFIDPTDGSVDLLNDRPPLVLEAKVKNSPGAPFRITVIVNHLRSLNDVDDPVDGPRVRAKRGFQAEFLALYIAGRSPSDRIISVGDYNAFQFNDGYVDSIGTIRGAPTSPDEVVFASDDLLNPNLRNLVELAPAGEQYSFTFDGNAQVLDHILITPNLFERFRSMSYGRNGADFPESYRGDASRPERVSDHDMPVAYFGYPE